MRSTPLAEAEYAVLRRTIAIRGTVRMALAAATFFVWAAMAAVALLYATLPITAFFSLFVLAAGFEAILALHIGVERIGRYLQVFYEEAVTASGEQGPRWETTAMAGGPALPGGGTDPLFAALFSAAVV